MASIAAEVKASFGSVKTGTIQDGLDSLGFFDQTLPPQYRVIKLPNGARSFIGRARNLLMFELAERKIPPFENSVKFWRFLESYIQEGDVIVVGFEGAIPECELVGGMLATLYKRRGAVGWIGSYVRDIDELAAIDMGFVALGTHPAIARGRVGFRGKDKQVRIGRVEINNDDYVIGDGDGVVVVPSREPVLQQVLAFVNDYIPKEQAAQRDAAAGVPLSDVIERYNIL